MLGALLNGHPGLRAGILGALVGSIVGLLANDSGSVVWGLVTAAPLAVLLDRMLEEQSEAFA